MSRAFDHHLYVPRPGSPRELSQRIELGELGTIAGVGNAAGPQAVAERDRHVVLAQDVENVVEPLVERILPAVCHHPHGVERATAAHYAGNSSVHQRQVLDQDSGVQCHVVDALLRLVLDHVE